MKLVNQLEQTLLSSEFAQPTNSSAVNITGAIGYAVQAAVTVVAPSAKAFATTDVDIATDAITEAAHGYKTGLKGQFTTTTTLPAGLSLATDYFLIAATAGTYKAATTLVNANAGTVVNITDQGVGTHTFTPTAIAGGTVKLQQSLDDSTYVDVASSSSNVTATANFAWSIADAYYKYFRVVYTLTAGQVSVVTKVLVKASVN